MQKFGHIIEKIRIFRYLCFECDASIYSKQLIKFLITFTEMVNKCSVPFCKSGYDSVKSRKKTHFFKFPIDPSMQNKWLKNISRQGFTPTDFSRVCSRHFTDDCFHTSSRDHRGRRSKLKKTYLKDDAVPTVFPRYPAYKANPLATVTPPRSERATSTVRLAMENEILQESIDSFEYNDTIFDLHDLKTKYVDGDCPFGFTVYDDVDNECLLFYKVSSLDIPKILHSLKVFSDLSFAAYNDGAKCAPSVFRNSMQFSMKILRFTDFMNLLSSLVNSENVMKNPIELAVDGLIDFVEKDNCLPNIDVKKIYFLCEQLMYINRRPGMHNPYSSSLLTTAILWQGHSTACYKAILNDGVLTLPSLRTLRRVAQSVDDLRSNTAVYLRQKASTLNVYEKTVSLMFDEVYVYQTIDYDNGRFVGLATNDDMPATTVLCFLIKSLCSKVSEMVAIIPVRGINVNLLREHCLQVLQVVEDSGFDVVSLIADNHPVNRSFFTSLSNNCHDPCVNPVNPDKKLFLLIDSTHIIKNIYNNFQKRKMFTFHHDCEFPNANFKHIEELYNLESSLSLRLAHKLSERVLNPTTIQRTSAKLAMSLFHDSSVAALKFYVNNGHEDWSSTSSFVSYVCDIIKILNIRTSSVGLRRNDPLKLPLECSSDHRLDSLSSFADFIRDWRNCKKVGLSPETSAAAENLCRNLRLLVIHLLDDRNFKFVLTGQISSDPIESRFGRYRQMSGGNYFISVKQLLESENKIKLSSLLNSGISLDSLCAVSKDIDVLSKGEVFEFHDLDDEISLSDNELQVVFYVSGYCGHRIKMSVSCDDCVSYFVGTDVLPEVEQPTEFFNLINRGRLKVPTPQLYNFLCKVYILFCLLKSSAKFKQFLRLRSPVNAFVSLVEERYFNDGYISDKANSCSHNLYVLWRRCVRTFFNCLSRNFVRSLQTQSDDGACSKKIHKLRSSRQ